MAALSSLAGVLTIGLVCLEVFRSLFHPSEHGAMSDWLARRVFNLFRRRSSLLPTAGPLVLVSVIVLWIAGLTLGFALIYFPAYPAEFRTSTSATPSSASRWLTATYFSFETVVTLGYGDLIPHSMRMRFIATLESLMGFGVLTASISSVVLIFPALSRLRRLARTVAVTVDAERRTGTASSTSAPLLLHLARATVEARIDLMHYPLVYYFAARGTDLSLPHQAGELVRIAAAGLLPDTAADARLAATMLDRALDDLASLLTRRFLAIHTRDTAAVFRAWAGDHAVGGAGGRAAQYGSSNSHSAGSG